MFAINTQKTKKFYEITCKRVKKNLGGVVFDSRIIGPEGEWSTKEGADLMFRKEAIFLHKGEILTDLNMLPVCE